MESRTGWIAACLIVGMLLPAMGGAAEDSRVADPGSLSPLAARAEDRGLAPTGFPVHVAVGLDLRSHAQLEAFLAQASDPASPLFQHWLTQDEFNLQYGPTAAQEQRVVDWLSASGFQVTQRFPNRLVVAADGTAQAAERAFGVGLHLVALDGQAHYAALDPPSFPADVAGFTTGVTGLDDLASMHPKANLGSNCCHFAPADVKKLYGNTVSQNGSGQLVVVAGAYAWKSSDISTFDSQWGLPALPSGSYNHCTGASGSSGCSFSASNSIEVSLDAETMHGQAPAAKIRNYMAATTSLADFQTMYNAVVSDNPGHTVSTSWGSCEAGVSSSTQKTNDNIFSNGNAKGQSWFASSGDGGSDDCGNGGKSVDHPANSPHVVGVGGTSAWCSSGMTSSSPACGGYGSEKGWSGSGGGKSTIFSKPSWQTGCSVPADGVRDVPDVALEADPNQYGNYVYENGGWYIVGGTSDAAPQWAAYFALLNQKKGGSGLGMPGTRLYQLCGTTNYHDITSGSNGAYSAAGGYDLVTGLGTAKVSTILANY